jgi:riboflavin kinase/FMN adenylyltransferase
MAEIIHWTLGEAARSGGALVAAIGNFDGVHQGHQQLIEKACQLAAGQPGSQPAVLTFSPHPRGWFRPTDTPFLLADEMLKNRLLAEAGAATIIHVTFDKALQQTEASDFAAKVLQPLNISHLVGGADFAFGKGRSGTLASLGESVAVTAMPLLTDENGAVISSSRIRAALQAGQPGLAAEMLGRPPVLAGPVLTGDQRGRQLDFPTANIQLGAFQHPAYGVYAILAGIEGVAGPFAGYFAGVANIGKRPTFADRGVLAEAHLFDFDQDIYGKRLEIQLKAFVRPEQKFTSLESLRAQIAADAAQAKECLGLQARSRA